jgi:hypothetical protein
MVWEKTYAEMRALCQEKAIAGVEAVDEILHDPAQPGSTRVARDTGFDRPAQRIAFKDFTDAPNDKLPADIDLFALPGAYDDVINGRATIIGVTPELSGPSTRSRALPAPEVDRETVRARQLAELRRMADEEAVDLQARRAPAGAATSTRAAATAAPGAGVPASIAVGQSLRLIVKFRAIS